MKKLLLAVGLLVSVMIMNTGCNNNADTTNTSTDTTAKGDSSTAEPEMSQPH